MDMNAFNLSAVLNLFRLAARPLKTSYYTATIPIWLDEITSPSTWSSEFLAPEAKEVLIALGAFIVCFRKPIDETQLKDVKDLLENVGEVIKEGCGMVWDGACLAVAMPQSVTPYLEKSFDDWEELCQQSGFEFVDFESKGRNEYSGEYCGPFVNRICIDYLRTHGYREVKRSSRD